MTPSRGRTAAVAGLALALVAVERPPGLADVTDVRHWSYADYTRVVVELSRPARVELRALPADARAGRPARLYFDVPGTWVGRRYPEPIPVADGLLRAVRIAQNTLSATRVVLDLERYGRHRVLRLDAPPRIVVDVFGARAPARAGLPPPLRALRTVVIDPGHGGSDPGAIGLGGVREKDVTLSLARRLRPRLEALGFRAVLTRHGDRTLSLLERTALAEGVGGDLFVSLHANAARRHGAQGVEIYTLDENSERQTLRLAARENGVALPEVDPLQRLLAELRLSESSARSTRLAEHVHGRIVSAMAQRWPSVRGPGLKRGPFYVLYLSDMPAILIEAGFLTHRHDVRRLRDPDYLDALADALAAGIAGFRSESEPMVAGAAR